MDIIAWGGDHWEIVGFFLGQLALGARAWSSLRETTRDNSAAIRRLQADVDDQQEKLGPMINEFKELQVDFKNLVERMREKDEEAVRERAQVLARVEAIGSSITTRIDGLYKLWAEKAGN